MQEKINYSAYLFIYAPIFICILQVIKNYRQLSKVIGENKVKSDDPFSVDFIEKIFHYRSDEPTINGFQKRIVRYLALILLLLFFGRTLL